MADLNKSGYLATLHYFVGETIHKAAVCPDMLEEPSQLLILCVDIDPEVVSHLECNCKVSKMLDSIVQNHEYRLYYDIHWICHFRTIAVWQYVPVT